MHKCSAYCTPAGQIHCYEVLAPPTATVADVEAFYRGIYQDRFVRADLDWVTPLRSDRTQAFLVWASGIPISHREYDAREQAFYATHPEIVRRLYQGATSPP